MNPDAFTQHLRSLELQLLQPATRKDPALLHLLIADDFHEIGASGRSYDKPAILAFLAAEQPQPPIQLSHFYARPLTPDSSVVLVTYRTTRRNVDNEPISSTKRSSIWIYRDNRWQITFHQGTPLS